MLDINKDNFEAEVVDTSKSKTVMLDFYSPKCEYCLEIMPDVEALAEKYSDKIQSGKLNIMENRRLAIGQKVLGIPTICFYKDGEKVSQLSGDDLTAEEIEDEIKKFV